MKFDHTFYSFTGGGVSVRQRVGTGRTGADTSGKRRETAIITRERHRRSSRGEQLVAGRAGRRGSRDKGA